MLMGLDPRIPLVEIYPKEIIRYMNRYFYIRMFIAIPLLIYILKIRDSFKCSGVS